MASDTIDGLGGERLAARWNRVSPVAGAGNDIPNGGAPATISRSATTTTTSGTAALGNDTPNGGGQADVFNGGDGVDTATYAGVTDPVTVTPDNVANDGTMNEQDKRQD